MNAPETWRSLPKRVPRGARVVLSTICFVLSLIVGMTVFHRALAGPQTFPEVTFAHSLSIYQAEVITPTAEPPQLGDIISLYGCEEVDLRGVRQGSSGARAAIDFVLVIDASYSLIYTDPQDQRLNAARLFGDLLLERERAAVIVFGNQAEQLLPLTQEREALREAVAKTSNEVIREKEKTTGSRPKTDMSHGLAAALCTLAKREAGGQNRGAVVVFTDGIPEPSGAPPANGDKERESAYITLLAEAFADQGWPVYGIRFCDKSRRSFCTAEDLPNATKRTDGLYFQAETVAEIPNAYIGVLADVYGYRVSTEKNPERFFVPPGTQQLIVVSSAPVQLVPQREPDAPLRPTCTDSESYYICRLDQPPLGLWTIQREDEDTEVTQLLADVKFSAEITATYPSLYVGRSTEVEVSVLDESGKVVTDTQLLELFQVDVSVQKEGREIERISLDRQRDGHTFQGAFTCSAEGEYVLVPALGSFGRAREGITVRCLAPPRVTWLQPQTVHYVEGSQNTSVPVRVEIPQTTSEDTLRVVVFHGNTRLATWDLRPEEGNTWIVPNTPKTCTWLNTLQRRNLARWVIDEGRLLWSSNPLRFQVEQRLADGSWFPLPEPHTVHVQASPVLRLAEVRSEPETSVQTEGRLLLNSGQKLTALVDLRCGSVALPLENLPDNVTLRLLLLDEQKKTVDTTQFTATDLQGRFQATQTFVRPGNFALVAALADDQQGYLTIPVAEVEVMARQVQWLLPPDPYHAQGDQDASVPVRVGISQATSEDTFRVAVSHGSTRLATWDLRPEEGNTWIVPNTPKTCTWLNTLQRRNLARWVIDEGRLLWSSNPLRFQVEQRLADGSWFPLPEPHTVHVQASPAILPLGEGLAPEMTTRLGQEMGVIVELRCGAVPVALDDLPTGIVLQLQLVSSRGAKVGAADFAATEAPGRYQATMTFDRFGTFSLMAVLTDGEQDYLTAPVIPQLAVAPPVRWVLPDDPHRVDGGQDGPIPVQADIPGMPGSASLRVAILHLEDTLGTWALAPYEGDAWIAPNTPDTCTWLNTLQRRDLARWAVDEGRLIWSSDPLTLQVQGRLADDAGWIPFPDTYTVRIQAVPAVTVELTPMTPEAPLYAGQELTATLTLHCGSRALSLADLPANVSPVVVLRDKQGTIVETVPVTVTAGGVGRSVFTAERPGSFTAEVFLSDPEGEPLSPPVRIPLELQPPVSFLSPEENEVWAPSSNDDTDNWSFPIQIRNPFGVLKDFLEKLSMQIGIREGATPKIVDEVTLVPSQTDPKIWVPEMPISACELLMKLSEMGATQWGVDPDTGTLRWWASDVDVIVQREHGGPALASKTLRRLGTTFTVEYLYQDGDNPLEMYLPQGATRSFRVRLYCGDPAAPFGLSVEQLGTPASEIYVVLRDASDDEVVAQTPMQAIGEHPGLYEGALSFDQPGTFAVAVELGNDATDRVRVPIYQKVIVEP